MEVFMKSVPETLREAAAIYEQRNTLYGENYKVFYRVMDAIFPDGIFAKGEDWNRIGMLIQMVNKLTRYIQNFDRGGHEDSLYDLSVYCHMLLELDRERSVKDLQP
jgi:hypothetical protein